MKGGNGFSGLLVVAVGIAMVLGCGKSQTCTGELTIDGKAFRGIDKNTENAKRNSCDKYCIDGDPEFDAMYRIWLDSPKSKGVFDRDNKWAAAAADKGLKEYVEKCELKCLQADKDGTRTIGVKCE